MPRLIGLLCAVLLSLSVAVDADEEVLFGPPPSSCRVMRPGQPVRLPRELTLERAVALVVEHTCRQFLVPRSLLTKKLALPEGLDVEHLDGRLDEILASAQLGSSFAAVQRIGPRATPEPTPPPAIVAPVAAKLDLATLGIACKGARCTIPHTSVERLLRDPEELLGSVRVVPAIREGAAYGMKLALVRAGSVLARLGFQKGDVVRRVNGLELGDPASAMGAYAQLRDARRFSVEIERDERALTVRIDTP